MTRAAIDARLARLLADALVRELRAEMAAAAAVHDASLLAGQGDTGPKTDGTEPPHAQSERVA